MSRADEDYLLNSEFTMIADNLKISHPGVGLVIYYLGIRWDYSSKAHLCRGGLLSTMRSYDITGELTVPTNDEIHKRFSHRFLGKPMPHISSCKI